MLLVPLAMMPSASAGDGASHASWIAFEAAFSAAFAEKVEQQDKTRGQSAELPPVVIEGTQSGSRKEDPGPKTGAETSPEGRLCPIGSTRPMWVRFALRRQKPFQPIRFPFPIAGVWPRAWGL